jgi:nucleoside-diphosphate-sugar epimerase
LRANSSNLWPGCHERKELVDKTCVVFGGSGFVGTHLTRRLAALGWSVIVADIRQPASSADERISYQYCDVREEIALAFATKISLVVNLAAVHRTPGHADSDYFSTNVGGAQQVAAFCEREHVPVLWFTSSISVYGPCEEPKRESDQTEPNSAYGKSKLEAETIYQAWQSGDAERRLVIVRPAAIFGPGEGGNFTRLARSLRSGVFFYAGRRDTIKSCGYVEDLIDSLFFMEQSRHGVAPYNFCYPNRYTIEDVCQTMAGVGGLRQPRGTVPVSLLLVAARLLGVAEKVLPSSGFGFHPERVYKLFRSTNIIPENLTEAGFPMPGGLTDGFTRWYEAEPTGEFV